MKKTLLCTFIVSLTWLCVKTNSLYAQVVINEFSCSNLDTYVDNHSDYNDWIELYNSGASTVSLSGYYLSDDSTNNTKWQFPAGVNIAAGGYLRIWASGRDETVGQICHTNFTLKQTKNNNEWVVLSDPSALRIDYIEITQKTQLGHSYGRTFDGVPFWSIFTSPTPAATNNTSTGYSDYADKPDYSTYAGFYSSTQTITITTTEPNSTIRYTTDGTIPTTTSTLYTGPVTISTTKVLKARTFSSNASILPSFIRYETYFINVSHTLPVVSISGNQLTTLANGSGSLEPHGTFEYFNTLQQRTASTYGEFNKHGQDSWANSQRSLDFVSRDEMGYNHSIEETLFNTSTCNNFQRIILRAAGDDNYPADHHTANLGSAHLRDAYIHNLALHGGMDLDVRRGSKCIVYLNGAYWGVYDLRDNPDDHDNTEYYYGQDKYHLYMIERWGSRWAEYGGQNALNEWDAFYNYIMANNMTVPANFQYVTDRYDVNSLVDYIAVNMFTVCSDWLNYNTAWWRGLDSTGTHLKWGYSLWDNDATFGHYINYTGIPNTNYTASPCDPQSPNVSDPDHHIDILMKLRQNPAFNTYYINRLVDLWNTVFDCDNMIPEFDSTVAVIDPEMSAHATRWFGTYTEWQTNVTILRDFIIDRCAALSTGFVNCFSLTGPYNLTVTADPINGGTVQLNSLTLNNLPWSGSYFGNINSSLTAMPNTNFNFINWSTQSSQTFNPNASSIAATVNLNASDTITAHFLTTSLPELPAHNPTLAAFPNIFSEETTVEYSLPEKMQVALSLYSMNGKLITKFIPEGTYVNAGHYAIRLNMKELNLPEGMYMINLVTGNQKKGFKLVYMPD